MSKFLFLKKHFIISFIFIFFILTFSFLYYNNNYIGLLNSYEENIITYVNNKIKFFQQKNPDINIKFKKININIDGITLKNVQITTKLIQKTHIPSLNLDLDWWSLASLNIKFKLTIPKIHLKVHTKQDKTKFKEKNKNDITPKFFLAELQKTIHKVKKNKPLLSLFSLPISSLNILEADIDLINKRNKKYLVRISNSIITFNLKKNQIKLDFFSSFTRLPNSFLRKKTFTVLIKATLAYNKNLVLWAKVGYKDLSALLKIDKNSTELKLSTQLKNIAELFNKKELKNLNGSLSLFLETKKPNNKFYFTSQLKNFKSYGFKIGDLSTHGFFKDNNLHVNQVNLESPIWSAKTKSFSINIKDKSYPISFHANIKKFQLKHLLKDNYVTLFAKSLATCTGKVYPFLLRCSLKDIYIEDLKVSLSNKKEILFVPLLKGLSQVTINTKSVNFKSSLSSLTNLNRNKITVNGNISYKSNSSIGYKSSLKSLSFLTFFKKNLSGNTKVTGLVQIKKNTTLNKNSFKSNNLSLGKVFLGNLNFNTLYSNQQLLIKNILLKNQDEKIEGNLDFLFKKNTLFSDVQAQNISLSKLIPFLNIKNKEFFSGKIKKLSSKTLWNLNFKPLSSNTQGIISNLLIKKVYFPAVNIYLKKNITNDFTFLKLNSFKKTFIIAGYIFNNLNVILNLNAKKMVLENFVHFSNPLSITSLADIKSKITGSLFKLNLKMNLKLYKTYFNKILQKNSNALIQYNNNKLSVLANLFNKTIFSDFAWNTKKMYFYNLSFKANNWDYSSLISFYSKTKKNIKANLTANLNLLRNKSNKYSGSLNIPFVNLNYSELNFKNRKNILVTLKDNILFIKNFSLKGKSGYLDVHSNPNANLDRLNIKINSNIRLPLFNDFLPETLIKSGNLSLNKFIITGNLLKPIFNGKIKINKLSTKNNNTIIPSVKNSNIDIHIINSKANLNKFTIDLEKQGILNASGFILLKNSFPVNITGKVSQLDLNTKEELKTLGSGNFKLSGKKGSYILQSTYNIISGSFYKKILNWNKKNLNIDDKFLPKKQLKNQNSLFSPILKLKLKTKAPLKTKIIAGNITIDTEAFGSLELNGPINRPLLNGRIYSNTGEIKVQKQTIFIDTIKIEYENTLLSNSNISLLAHSEVNKIKIKIKARGLLDNIQFILSSDPPLPENKIAFLLVFGSLPEESNSNWKEASKRTSYSILSSLLKNYLKIKENLNLNLDLTTKASNDTEVTSSGNIKLKSNKPILNLEKKITDKLKIQATRELDEESKNTFLLQYQINPHLSIKSSISEENNINSSNNKKNIEFGLEYDIEFE